MKKNTHSGHFCKVCGMVKANEKFSGKGHRRHICKDCAKLSPDLKLEAMHINTINDLPDTRKGRRQLKLFMEGKKYTEKTKAAAKKHLEMLIQFRDFDFDDYDFNSDQDYEEDFELELQTDIINYFAEDEDIPF